ncbi:MAG: hypothetical protein J1E64_00475 [Acetatifactor sp.]|nr:hypothetical protein [Acetatifactor sp.]
MPSRSNLSITREEALLFFTTLALMTTSGSNWSIWFLAVVAVATVIINGKLDKNNVLIAVLLSSLLFLNSYVLGKAAFDMHEYLVYIARFMGLALVAAYLNYNRFFEMYARILYWVFIVTIPLWAITLICNHIGLGGILPTGLLNLIMMDSTSSLLRLKAIFWEGGVCAIHANIALTYCICKGINERRVRRMAAVFVLAVLCSVSTTGYIVLVLQVVLYCVKNAKSIRFQRLKIPRKIVIIFLIGLGVFIVEEAVFGVVVGKLLGGEHSFSSRYDDTLLALLIAKDNFWYGIGVATDTQIVFLEYFYTNPIYKKYQKYFAPDLASSNGLGNCMYKAGVLFTLFYLVIIYFRLHKTLKLSRIESALIWLMYFCFFFGEPIMSVPMMLMFFFSIKDRSLELAGDNIDEQRDNIYERSYICNNSSL